MPLTKVCTLFPSANHETSATMSCVNPCTMTGSACISAESIPCMPVIIAGIICGIIVVIVVMAWISTEKTELTSCGSIGPKPEIRLMMSVSASEKN